MFKLLRGGLTLGLLLTVVVAASRAQEEKGEMVENPKYKLWANFKPGASVKVNEVTKFHGEDKETVPGGVDRKSITYRLISKDDKRVIVGTVVTEDTLLGTVESAPTRTTYPAKITKAALDAVLEEFNAKPSDDETVKAAGKDFKCKVLKGNITKGKATIDFKLCYTDEVPGGIVQRTRTTKLGDKPVAETTITMVSFSLDPPPKKDKAKDK
jgi:hypothetical protein